LAAAQLGLTPEKAKAVHKECICAQEEIQREFEEENQARHRHKAQQDVHDTHPPPPGHLTCNTTNHDNTSISSPEHHGELDPPMEPN
jgi:hypothetical protein